MGLLVGGRLSSRLRGVITDGLGLATILIGVRLGLKTGNPLIVIGAWWRAVSSGSGGTWRGSSSAPGCG